MSKSTTKTAIAYAFRDLLLEKPVNKVTINDITEKCGINRQTFSDIHQKSIFTIIYTNLLIDLFMMFCMRNHKR